MAHMLVEMGESTLAGVAPAIAVVRKEGGLGAKVSRNAEDTLSCCQAADTDAWR